MKSENKILYPFIGYRKCYVSTKSLINLIDYNKRGIF